MARSEPVPFGKYTLLCLLGAGAMARVYRAAVAGALGFQKTVALKMLDPRVSRNRKFISALINEARIGGQLKSPNVVEVYEFNHVEGNYYLAMEFVDGWTLEAVLHAAEEAQQPLPPRIVALWGMGIARGIHAAHTLTDDKGNPMDLVHRDLKPGNVMVSREGIVKVMDFGIAKARSNVHRTSVSEGPKGTPVFMSPEQITEAGLVDARSDIFAMGSLLCELATFTTPFDAENPLVVMRKVLHDDPRPFVQAADEVVPGLGPIIERCLERDMDARYQDALELANDLSELASSLDEATSSDLWLRGLHELPDPIEDGDFGPGSFVPEVPQAQAPAPPAQPTTPEPEPPPPQPIAKPSRWPLILGMLFMSMVIVAFIFRPWEQPDPTPALTQEAPDPTPVPTPIPTAKPTPKPTPKPSSTRVAVQPRSTPRPTPPPTPPPEQGDGYLTVSSKPWGIVSVDGVKVGETPVRKHVVPAGMHKIAVTCSDGIQLTDHVIEKDRRVHVGEEVKVRVECPEP